MVDMRDAFFEGVYNIIKDNKDAIILTADHGAFKLSEIERDFPDQFLNIGIAEQNAISVAAGLAKSGKVVYVYSINNFITLRAMEQVNIDLCQMNLNVNLIGVGAGFTYATDGPTHQGVQDMQAMRVLPNMQVYNCTDATQSTWLAEMSYKTPGPKYFRIEKGSLSDIYTDKLNLSGMQLFSKTFPSSGSSKEIVIVSTGYMTHTALTLANVSSWPHNIPCSVLDVYQIKPFNENIFLELVKHFKTIIVLEENTQCGGLGELIGYTIAKNNIECKFIPISLGDKHYFSYGSRELLHTTHNIDYKSIYNTIAESIDV